MQGLLSVIQGMSFIEELLLYPHLFLANIGYMGRVNMSQGHESTSSL